MLPPLFLLPRPSPIHFAVNSGLCVLKPRHLSSAPTRHPIPPLEWSEFSGHPSHADATTWPHVSGLSHDSVREQQTSGSSSSFPLSMMIFGTVCLVPGTLSFCPVAPVNLGPGTLFFGDSSPSVAPLVDRGPRGWARFACCSFDNYKREPILLQQRRGGSEGDGLTPSSWTL